MQTLPKYNILAKVQALSGQQAWTGDLVYIKSNNRNGMKPHTLGLALPGWDRPTAGWVPSIYLGFDLEKGDSATSIHSFQPLGQERKLWVSTSALGLISIRSLENNQALFYQQQAAETITIKSRPTQGAWLGPEATAEIRNPYAVIKEYHPTAASLAARKEMVRIMQMNAMNRLLEENDLGF